MRKDNGGQFWFAGIAIGAAVGAVVSAAVSVVSQAKDKGFSNVNWKTVAVNAASGAISGGFAASGIGLGASVAVNSVLGAGTYVAEQVVSGQSVTVGGVFAGTIAGGFGGLIGGKGANAELLKQTWNSASQGIAREMRRQNQKYAAKQIAKYVVTRNSVKSNIITSTVRLVGGTIGGSWCRGKLGY